MISVYSNNHFTDKIIQSLDLPDNFRITHSIEQHRMDSAATKLAFVNCLNSFDSFESEQHRIQWVVDGNGFGAELHEVKKHSDVVFAFDNEIHPYHRALFDTHCESNVYWVIPAHINDLAVPQNNVILWNFVLDQTKKFYAAIPHKLRQLDHVGTKPLYFDALLGTSRPHRDFLYQTIKTHRLQDKIKMTYLKPNLNDDSVKFEWDSDVDIAEFGDPDKVYLEGTWRTVSYHGQNQPMARIIPINVYNQSAYSIIAETGYNNFYSFYTEKTAKTILAKRLFVMFSGYKFLQNFRQLGFQTFDSVIDESYDLIPDNDQRWCAAFQQVQQLCTQDQQQVFEKIQPIVEHNYSVLLDTDWDQRMQHDLQAKLDHYFQQR